MDSGNPTVVRAITPAISKTKIISKKHARLALRLARLTCSSRASVRGFMAVLPSSYDVTLLSFIDNKTTIIVSQASSGTGCWPVSLLLSLQTVPAREEEPRKGVAQYAGFSLHAGIGVEAKQREKLERLARYVSRPPVSAERLDLTAQGQVRYRLKTPYRDGTTHIVLEPWTSSRASRRWCRRRACT
jgi:hypothetical protein